LIKADISLEESIYQNLNTWCFEVGSHFEEMGKQAALDFLKYANLTSVLELGAGDGSSTEIFIINNFSVLAIDINWQKLQSIHLPAVTWEWDMLKALQSLNSESVDNIFTHHSLEHVVDADEVIREASRVLKYSGIYYAIVPADDYLHSVHHVVFESAKELLPPGLTPIKMKKQTRNDPEFICIAQKLA